MLASRSSVCARARELEVAEGEARPAEQEHLHEPVERDRDLAEEVEAEELRRDQDVVDARGASSASTPEARKMLYRSGSDAKRHFDR